MKLSVLAVLMLCAYAHSATTYQNVVDGSIDGYTSFQQLHLRAESPESASEDDQLLSKAFQEIERVQGRNAVADMIRNLLESARPVIINGNDVLPPLDPLQINELGPVNLSVSGIRVTASLRTFRADGLAWYVVEHTAFNALRLNIEVQVMLPHLTFTGAYDANAVVLFITHRAGGNYRVFVNRLEVGVNVRLGTSIFGGHLLLRELGIDIAVSDVTIRIEGMFGSGLINGFINSFVQSITQNLVQNEMENLGPLISSALFDTIDGIIRGFTLDDLLGNN